MRARTLSRGQKQPIELENFMTPPRNIQFHITAVEGLWSSSAPSSSPQSPTPWLSKLSPQRIVQVVAKNDRRTFTAQTDAVAESVSTWNENMKQMGPLLDSDKVTFHIIRRSLVGLRVKPVTVAASKEYTVRSLLTIQGKQDAKTDIKIPLEANHSDNVDAILLLQVREPTTAFVSKQWLREATQFQRRSQALQTQYPEELRVSFVTE